MFFSFCKGLKRFHSIIPYFHFNGMTLLSHSVQTQMILNDENISQVGGGEDELPGECGVPRAGQETQWQTGSHAPSHTQEAGTNYTV